MQKHKDLAIIFYNQPKTVRYIQGDNMPPIADNFLKKVE